MSTLALRIRRRFTTIPGVIFLMIVIFWGGDQAIRVGLDWSQVVWLLIVAGVISLLAMLVVLPVTLMLDATLAKNKVSKSGRYLTYAFVFAVIGAAVGISTNVISIIAALSAGLAAGLLIAKVCETSDRNTSAKGAGVN